MDRAAEFLYRRQQLGKSRSYTRPSSTRFACLRSIDDQSSTERGPASTSRTTPIGRSTMRTSASSALTARRAAHARVRQLREHHLGVRPRQGTDTQSERYYRRTQHQPTKSGHLQIFLRQSTHVND